MASLEGMRVRLIVGLAAGCLLAAPACAGASFPGGDGRFALARWDGVSTEVYTVERDGSGVTKLTTGAAYYMYGVRYRYSRDPAWSPDGRRIAFSSDRSGDEELWIMDADGSDPVQVTSIPGSDARPSWSPDGSHLVFTHASHLWTIAVDGSNATQITFGAGYDTDAKWSPAGDMIAFSRWPGGGVGDIHAVRPDGADERRLTDTDEDTTPDWSPDALLIAYRNDHGIKTMRPDGSDQRLLPSTFGPSHPVWAPEGDHLAAIDNGALVTFSENGFAERQVVLPQDQYSNGPPSWQPTQPPPPVPGYPRPKGAATIKVSLVPAYTACDQPNETHGAPLAFGSCAPAALESAYLTGGTPEVTVTPPSFPGPFASTSSEAIQVRPTTRRMCESMLEQPACCAPWTSRARARRAACPRTPASSRQRSRCASRTP
jgi:dipeptidyl aminopeptidase/acylaminoacyl peptidase